MAEQTITKLYFPNGSDVAVLDFGAYKDEVNASLTTVTNRLDALESGSRQFALKDYSQTANQDEMVVGVYYYVGFDSDGVYVAVKDDGTADGTVAYFDIYMKSSDGTVTLITRQYTQANLQDVAYTNKEAVFEAGIKKSATSDWSSLTDTDLVAKAEVQTQLDALTTTITNATQDATDTQKGVVLLSDAVDSTLAAASGVTAATPAAVKTAYDKALEVENNLAAVTDVIGTSAENAALVNASNTFTQSQKISNASASLVLNDTSADVGTIAIDTTSGNKVSVSATNGSYSGEIAITVASDGTTTATAPSTASTATSNEIATADFVASKVSDLQTSIETDLTGYAKLDADNTFTGNNTFTSNDVSLVLNGEGITAAEDDSITVGAGDYNLTIDGSTGSITRTDMPTGDDVSDNEVVTKGYVDDAITTATANLVSATTEQAGIIEIATDAEVTTGTDTERAVTPAGVQVALSNFVQVVTSDSSVDTSANKIWIVVESGE